MKKETKILLVSLVVLILVLILNVSIGNFSVLHWQQTAKVPVAKSIGQMGPTTDRCFANSWQDIYDRLGVAQLFNKSYTHVSGVNCGFGDVWISGLDNPSCQYALKILPNGPVVYPHDVSCDINYEVSATSTGVMLISNLKGSIQIKSDLSGSVFDTNQYLIDDSVSLSDISVVPVGKHTVSVVSQATDSIPNMPAIPAAGQPLSGPNTSGNCSSITGPLLPGQTRCASSVVQKEVVVPTLVATPIKTVLKYETCSYGKDAEECQTLGNFLSVATCKTPKNVIGSGIAAEVCSAPVVVENDKISKIVFKRLPVNAGYIKVELDASVSSFGSTKVMVDGVNYSDAVALPEGSHTISVITSTTSLSQTVIQRKSCFYDTGKEECQVQWTEKSGKLYAVCTSKTVDGKQVQTCNANTTVNKGRTSKVGLKRVSVKEPLPNLSISRPPNLCAVVKDTFKPELEITLSSDGVNGDGTVDVLCDDKFVKQYSVSKDKQPLIVSPCSFGPGFHWVKVENDEGSDSRSVSVVVPGKETEGFGPLTADQLNRYFVTISNYVVNKNIADVKTGEISVDKVIADMLTYDKNHNGVLDQTILNDEIDNYLKGVGVGAADRVLLSVALKASGIIKNGVFSSAMMLDNLPFELKYKVDGRQIVNSCPFFMNPGKFRY